MTPSTVGYGQEQYSFLARIVISLSGGKIETENQAQYVLAGVGAVVLIITVVVLMKVLGSNSIPPPDQIIQVASPDAVPR